MDLPRKRLAATECEQKLGLKRQNGVDACEKKHRGTSYPAKPELVRSQGDIEGICFIFFSSGWGCSSENPNSVQVVTSIENEYANFSRIVANVG